MQNNAQPTPKQVEQHIKERRNEINISMPELGGRVGANKPTIQRYETDSADPKRAMIINGLAEALLSISRFILTAHNVRNTRKGKGDSSLALAPLIIKRAAGHIQGPVCASQNIVWAGTARSDGIRLMDTGPYSAGGHFHFSKCTWDASYPLLPPSSISAGSLGYPSAITEWGVTEAGRPNSAFCLFTRSICG